MERVLGLRLHTTLGWPCWLLDSVRGMPRASLCLGYMLRVLHAHDDGGGRASGAESRCGESLCHVSNVPHVATLFLPRLKENSGDGFQTGSDAASFQLGR